MCQTIAFHTINIAICHRVREDEKVGAGYKLQEKVNPQKSDGHKHIRLEAVSKPQIVFEGPAEAGLHV